MRQALTTNRHRFKHNFRPRAQSVQALLQKQVAVPSGETVRQVKYMAKKAGKLCKQRVRRLGQAGQRLILRTTLRIGGEVKTVGVEEEAAEGLGKANRAIQTGRIH